MRVDVVGVLRCEVDGCTVVAGVEDAGAPTLMCCELNRLPTRPAHVPSMVQPGGVVIEFSKDRWMTEAGFMPKSVVQAHWLIMDVEGSIQPRSSPA